MYRFVDLSRSAPPVGAPVLGIDVAREHGVHCNRGNLIGEPHRGCYRDVSRPELLGRAAIDIATAIALPPDGAVLATSSPTLDTVGAMAVLVLRRLGYAIQPDGGSDGYCGSPRWRDARARVRRIAARATYRPSPTLGWRR